MIMITKMLTLTIVNTDDNDKENDSNDNESDNNIDNGYDNNDNNKMKILQPLTFDINTLNLQKHFATVPSLKVDCKRIPPNQVSF